jgi:hypothetical protein
MPSPAQYAANKLNALLSPGATSPQGRARSSMNALRHGLTARVVVLPTEDMNAYKAFSKEIADSLDAQTPVERQFAQTVADNQWRINRIRSIEDGMLGMGHYEAAGNFDADHPEIHAAMTAARAFRDNSQAFVNLSIYEQRLHRSLKEALRQLKELQAERRDNRQAEMDDAIRVSKTQQMKGLPFDPDENGFVYASAEIAKESARRDRLQDSLLAEKANFNRAEYHRITQMHSYTAADLDQGRSSMVSLVQDKVVPLAAAVANGGLPTLPENKAAENKAA